MTQCSVRPCDRKVRRYAIYSLPWGLVPSDFEGLVFFVGVVSPRPVACQGWWACPTQVSFSKGELYATSSAFTAIGSFLLFCLFHRWVIYTHVSPLPPSQPLGIFSSSAWSTVGTKYNLCDLIRCHSRWEFPPLPPDPPLGCIGLVQPLPLSQPLGILLFRLIHRWVT